MTNAPTEKDTTTAPGRDDRRAEVKPHTGPVPSSPPAEDHAVKEGEEKLGRVGAN